MKSSTTKHNIIKKFLFVTLSLALTFTLFSCGKPEEEPAPEVEAPVVQKPDPVINCLTGKRGPEEDVIASRVVAVVVENHPEARPQWGMDAKKNSPDIILEGEVEGGITRMLWMWADYNKLPEYVGPVRSARPPFIRFSELFDAMFVHWGRSHTKGNYTGANYYFTNDKVDHLDGMNYERKEPFDRMQGTGRAIEHTAIVYGESLPKALESKFETGFSADKTTRLKFYEKKSARGKKNSCYQLTLKFSDIGGTTDWKYNKKSKKYTSDSFNNNVSRDNLLVLLDETEYIDNGYTTYCNYGFKGGTAYYASCGSYQKIKWSIKDGKLYLYKKVTVKSDDGTKKTKKKAIRINPGKTWIGWASSNNNGICTIKSKADVADSAN